MQRCLDVRDYFVREQITVSVDRPIVVVIGLQWIVTIGWIPVAPVQEIISGVYENDGLTIVVPPVSIMPGMAGILEQRELRDVVAYLTTLKLQPVRGKSE